MERSIRSRIKWPRPEYASICRVIAAAHPRTVELRLDLDEDIPAIEADAAQVQQLVMNLVINGAEAIPDGKPGTVTIATRRQTIDVCGVGAQVGVAAGAGQLKPGLYAQLFKGFC